MTPLHQAVPRLVARIDAVTLRAGETVRWLTLAIPIVCVAYAVARKLFRWGHNGFSELQWYLFGAVYLVAAGYTLLRQGHVRVDVLWRRFTPRTRALVDLAGFAALLPICIYLAAGAWTFWTVSLRQREGPEDVLVGLERWPVKLALFVGLALLALQVLAEALRRIGQLRGWPVPAAPGPADAGAPGGAEDGAAR